VKRHSSYYDRTLIVFSYATGRDSAVFMRREKAPQETRASPATATERRNARVVQEYEGAWKSAGKKADRHAGGQMKKL
jgi:hypothetical protein